ncbi:MAG TPA: hypothetical protein VF681_01295 [Abditibacteriaceae bacterium]
MDIIEQGQHFKALGSSREWVLAKGKNGKTGYAPLAILARVTDRRVPELSIYSDGYKHVVLYDPQAKRTVGHEYHHSFTIHNSGSVEYKGAMTLRVFNEDGLVVEETNKGVIEPAAVPDSPMVTVVTAVEITHYEFEVQGVVHRGETKGRCGMEVLLLPPSAPPKTKPFPAGLNPGTTINLPYLKKDFNC